MTVRHYRKTMRKPRQHIVLDLTDADEESKPLILEDKIPLPNRFRTIASRYPFAAMKVGQSFFVPGDPLPTCRKLCQASNMFLKANPGKKFTVRSRNAKQPLHVNALREVGARVWRVE